MAERVERDRQDRQTDETALASLPSDVRQEVDRLISERRKIEAIKAFREATGLGLKQSKDAVEMRQHAIGAG